MLLEGRDDQDPLFLQIKEAVPSVLEDHLRPSKYSHQGQRVVEGQRLVQAQTDIFLGWTNGSSDRQFYVRQLRDWKGSADVDQGTRRSCGSTPGCAPARWPAGTPAPATPVAISAYMGTSASSTTRSRSSPCGTRKQNLRDYAAFQQAVHDGLVPVSEEVL